MLLTLPEFLTSYPISLFLSRLPKEPRFHLGHGVQNGFVRERALGGPEPTLTALKKGADFSSLEFHLCGMGVQNGPNVLSKRRSRRTRAKLMESASRALRDDRNDEAIWVSVTAALLLVFCRSGALATGPTMSRRRVLGAGGFHIHVVRE